MLVYGDFLAKCGRRRDIKARFPACALLALLSQQNTTPFQRPFLLGCARLVSLGGSDGAKYISERATRSAGPGRARFRVFWPRTADAAAARDGRAAGGQLVRRPAAITVGAPPIRPVTSRTSQCGGRQRARPAGLAGAAARHSGGVTRGRRERAPPWAAARGSGAGARGGARGSSAACPAACAAPRGAGGRVTFPPPAGARRTRAALSGEPAGRRGAVHGASSEKPPEMARVRVPRPGPALPASRACPWARTRPSPLPVRGTSPLLLGPSVLSAPLSVRHKLPIGVFRQNVLT